MIILDELSAPLLVWRTWRGETPRVLLVDPILPPLKRPLEKLLAWAKGRGAAELIDDHPECAAEWAYPKLLMTTDLFTIIEPWQNSHHRFDLADGDSDYGFAVKLLATMHTYFRYSSAFLLHRHAADPAVKPEDLEIPPEILGLTRAWYGPDTLAGVTARWRPNRLINVAVALFGLAAALVFTLTRLRRHAPREPVFVMADHNGDWRDDALYEALGQGGELVVVMRNAEIRKDAAKRGKTWRQCLPGDGVFDPADALQAAAQAIRDSWAIWRRWGVLAPSLYATVALLPWRRLVQRALFNRWRPRYFWSRDDYNVEHVLRRQELHRFGAQQHGLNHAAQGIGIVVPHLRWVSMDVYYTIGTAFHRHYRDSWPADMELRSIGAFAFTREYLARQHRSSRDILIMARFVIGNPEFVRTVRMTAEAFPERTILVQIKRGYPHDAQIAAFIEECSHGLANVVYTTEPVYDLISRADYVISDPSTIVVETIQLGTPVLNLDIMPDTKTSIFHEFPGLCVSSAEETVAQLRRWISGEESYDPSRFSALVALTRQPYYDQVCQGMGLPVPPVAAVA
ncbi:hypothetical protein CCC_00801 [Paramagnetospirillum magnetotacticum MS-1]|uniref:Uncharacterized protein n=1 Tax=Paramagnetospirillum magnetotacticum MS-1 TaxID=272627 RepID=A0A0C2YSP3_PARME|nr:hypothetical protein CCC_00801 [Paramagnetospirillum magnetotacticum MS-1]